MLDETRAGCRRPAVYPVVRRAGPVLAWRHGVPRPSPRLRRAVARDRRGPGPECAVRGRQGALAGPPRRADHGGRQHARRVPAGRRGRPGCRVGRGTVGRRLHGAQTGGCRLPGAPGGQGVAGTRSPGGGVRGWRRGGGGPGALAHLPAGLRRRGDQSEDHRVLRRGAAAVRRPGPGRRRRADARAGAGLQRHRTGLRQRVGSCSRRPRGTGSRGRRAGCPRSAGRAVWR